MESKRSDNRRRRVLYDEAVQQVPVPIAGGDASATKRRRSSNYGARGNHQLRTSDLIPTRWLTQGVIASCSLLVLGVVNLLHWFSSSAPGGILDDAARQAFRLTSPNGLAVWLSSVAFIVTSLYCLQIFAMRRHRRDDYRGTYRVWLIFAALFLITSVHCVVPLNRVAVQVFTQAIQLPIVARGEVGVATIKLSFLLAVFLRMIIEIRFCRSALILLVFSLIAHASAVLIEVPAVVSALGSEAHWFTDNLQLLGAFTMLHCAMAYSRYVCLDVHGLLARRARRSRKRKSRSARNRGMRNRAAAATPNLQPAARAAASPKLEWSSSHKASATPPPTTSSIRPAAAKSSPLKSKIDAIKSNAIESDDDDSLDDNDDDGDTNSNTRLSKAERRRLKKLHRQQRNAA